MMLLKPSAEYREHIWQLWKLVKSTKTWSPSYQTMYTTGLEEEMSTGQARFLGSPVVSNWVKLSPNGLQTSLTIFHLTQITDALVCTLCSGIMLFALHPTDLCVNTDKLSQTTESAKGGLILRSIRHSYIIRLSHIYLYSSSASQSNFYFHRFAPWLWTYV